MRAILILLAVGLLSCGGQKILEKHDSPTGDFVLRVELDSSKPNDEHLGFRLLNKDGRELDYVRTLAGAEVKKINNTDKYIAQYWKNGVAVPLTSSSSGVSSIIVVSDDVYLTGSESNGTKEIAKYWKNGIGFSLTDGTSYSFGHDIGVAGSDIYVVGGENTSSGFQVAKYWKNDKVIPLTNGSTGSRATAIFIK